MPHPRAPLRPSLPCLLFALCLAIPAFAQQGPPTVGAATRGVSTAMDLETKLLRSSASQERAAFEQLLDPEFEARSPASPDVRTREQWLADELKHPKTGYRVRDLSVFESDDLAIATFLLESPGSGKKRPPSYFVVDVWRQSSGKLLHRSIDMPAKPPAFRERPDGRM